MNKGLKSSLLLLLAAASCWQAADAIRTLT
jgi:hypothetical protein